MHGHSLRLEENGMQFDMLARTEMGKDGNVYQVKDQVGIPLDKKVNLGKPMTEAEAKKRTTIFRADGVPMCGKEPGSTMRQSGSASYVGAAQQVGIQAGVNGVI